MKITQTLGNINQTEFVWTILQEKAHQKFLVARYQKNPLEIGITSNSAPRNIRISIIDINIFFKCLIGN